MSQPEHIFHIATRDDWQKAVRSGTYTTSTLGRTLDDEGFIHASRHDQVAGVFDRYYRDAPDLVLLRIDPARLSCKVREERVGDDTYPHIYGPIVRRAVVDVVPLRRNGRPHSLASIFLGEMLRRMGVALLVMVAIATLVLVVQRIA